MLYEDELSIEDTTSADANLGSGFVDREYQRTSAGPLEDLVTKAAIKYPILNFFGGSVTTDRVRHENAAHNGGLKHWRHNTSKQREEDDHLSHINRSGNTDYDMVVPHSAKSYDSASHSTGMGLEGGNLHSFITTGSHYKIVPLDPALQAEDEPSVQPDVCARQDVIQTISVVKMYIAPQAAAAGSAAIFKYRSKARATWTNLPPLAANQ
jgi:hypothetical protein